MGLDVTLVGRDFIGRQNFQLWGTIQIAEEREVVAEAAAGCGVLFLLFLDAGQGAQLFDQQGPIFRRESGVAAEL